MKNFCAAGILWCLSISVPAQQALTVAAPSKDSKKSTADTRQSFHKRMARLEQDDMIDPSEIDIVRDAYGVPHIFAKTDREVAYGLAWAHAEDDFLTLQKCFLASKAMLGLYSGREGASVDYIVQLLRIRELVDSLYDDSISDYYKQVLQGYCDGFNAYARTHPKEVVEKKGLPIFPKDVIAYSVLQLAVGCKVDDAIKKIFDGSVPLVFETDGLEPERPVEEAEGSNAFAFNSSKTDDGSVYLAINTHHPLEGQVAWYEAHLSSEEGWNIVGALFPGAPVIFTGVNENLAWTHTVNHPDRLDVYQLEINPENELQYKFDGAWLTLEESFARLKVKVPGFNLHMKKKIYWSVYGPTIKTDRGTFSIRTAGITDIRGLEQWFWMNKSRNFAEFRSALKMEALPSYNLVYGDRYDTIFYISNGRIPVRQPGFNWPGTVPGNTSATLWNDFYPIESLPSILNPKSGYVFNTNHAPFKASDEIDNLHESDFAADMGFETFDNNRSIRMRELINVMGKIDYDEFKKIKYDLKLPKELAFPVDIDAVFALDPQQHPELADIIRELQQWNREGNIESTGATVFASFFYIVAERYTADPSFKKMETSDCLDALEVIQKNLLKNFGTVSVPLGQYQLLVRGEKTLGLPGLPDVLAAMYSTPLEDGRVKGTVGECYIGLIQFTKDGPSIETINCFGASNRVGSRHYDDQMELFQQQKTKPMYLERERVLEHAESLYHPEVLPKLPMSARITRSRR